MKRIFAMTWRVPTLCALMLCSVLVMGSMVGCTPGQLQQAEQVVDLVTEAGANILTIADPGADWVALLPAALAGLKTAETSFQQGTGAKTDVSNALLAVEDVIASVAPGSKVSQFADILTTAIDAALLVFPPSSTSDAATAAFERSQVAVPSVNSPHGVVMIQRNALIVKYNHHSKASLKWMPFRSPAGNFKATWNAAVRSDPQLAPALLK